MIRFGPTTNPLGKYYVFNEYDHVFLIRVFNEPAELFSSLKNLINAYHVRVILVEEPSSLIKVRKMLLGRTYLNNVKWRKKYKRILDVRNTIADVVSPVSVDFFEAKDEDYINSIKFSYRNFVKLTDDGEAIFAHKKIKFSMDELFYAAAIYGTIIADDMLIFGKPNDKNILFKNVNNKTMLIISGEDINEPIEVQFNEFLPDDKIKAFNKDYKLVALRSVNDKLEVRYYLSPNEYDLFNALTRDYVKEMINWINETKNIDFLLGIMVRDPIKALKFAKKFKK